MYESGSSFRWRKSCAAVKGLSGSRDEAAGQGLSLELDELEEAQAGRTTGVVRQLEGGLALGNVDVKDVVVLDPVEQLLAARANGVDDLADLLPRLESGRPLPGGSDVSKKQSASAWNA